MRWGPVVLIVVGVVFLANNLGLLDLRELRAVLHTWWPAILIVIGVVGLMSARSRR